MIDVDLDNRNRIREDNLVFTINQLREELETVKRERDRALEDVAYLRAALERLSGNIP